MLKNQSKINQRLALIILAVMAAGLLNVCLVALQAKTAKAAPASKFFYNSNTCALEEIPAGQQTVNRPDAPMPSCCLERSNYYTAIIKTDNNKQIPFSLIAAVSPASHLNLNNQTSNKIAVLIHPPPALRALATTVIRE